MTIEPSAVKMRDLGTEERGEVTIAVRPAGRRRQATGAVAAPMVQLTVEADPGGQPLADVVRIVLEELRDPPPSGDE